MKGKDIQTDGGKEDEDELNEEPLRVEIYRLGRHQYLVTTNLKSDGEERVLNSEQLHAFLQSYQSKE